MNMKILSAGLIAAISNIAVAASTTAPAAPASSCRDGGFYAMLNVGGSFNKGKMEVDKDKLKATFTAWEKDVIAKLSKIGAALKSDEKKINAAAEEVANAIYDIIKEGDALNYDTSYSGSVYSIIKDNDVVKKSYSLYRILKYLETEGEAFKDAQQGGKYDTDALDDDANLKLAILEAVKVILKDGKGNVLKELIPAQDELLFVDVANSNVTVSQLQAEASDKAFTAAATAYDAYKTPKGDFETAKAALLKHLTDAKLPETVLSAVKNATDSSDITSALTSYMGGKFDTEIKELGLNDKNRVSKKATGFLVELAFGADKRVSDFMFGVDLGVAAELGGKVKFKDTTSTSKNGITVQRQFALSLMPRVGYLFTPELEGFISVGGSLGRYKADTKHFFEVFNHHAVLKDLAVASKLKTTDDFDSIFKAHKKTKFSLVLSAGVQYNINSNLFARLSYSFMPSKTIVTQEKAGAKLSFTSHVVKAGVGFAF